MQSDIERSSAYAQSGGSAGIQRPRKVQEGTTEQASISVVWWRRSTRAGPDDQMRDRDTPLPRGDRNIPITREPPLAECIRVVARSSHNNFAVLGGSAVTSSHEVLDLGRADMIHRPDRRRLGLGAGLPDEGRNPCAWPPRPVSVAPGCLRLEYRSRRHSTVAARRQTRRRLVPARRPRTQHQ
jgi:hypothetical protein